MNITPAPERAAGCRSLDDSVDLRRWPYDSPDSRALPATSPDGRPWPRISIVTPSFNQGQYIEETLLSVFNQNYPNVEHLIIDGGSKDATPHVLERYRERLAYVVSEPDKGQSHAINKGLARATGDILTWLNSDDMLAPGALAAIALAFATNPQAEVVSGICCLYENGKIIGRHLTACHDGPLPLDELLDLDGAWLLGQFFYQPEVFFSRSLWERAGGCVDESLYYSMDYDLWVRFAEVGGKLHTIGRPLAWYRVHPHQKTYVSTSYTTELRICRDAHLTRLQRPASSRRRQAAFDHKLKIAVINDIGGRYGAGIAQARIVEGLRRAGHDVEWAQFGARRASSRAAVSDSVALRRWLDDVAPHLAIVGNLHGADADPLLVSIIAETCPTICVLHDFWLLTGRCAYTAGCTKFRNGCDNSCPTPSEYPALEANLIAEAWTAKRLTLSTEQRPTLAAYTPSAAAFARSAFCSGFGAAQMVPNVEEFRLGIPVEIYRVQDRVECRRRLNLPLDRFIILFSAASIWDKRKGADHLLEALSRIGLDAEVTCCVLGYLSSPIDLPGIEIRRMGVVDNPQQLAMIYAAADVYVGPSFEETFGQVFVEAAACGTPTIGYPVTGVKDAIRDGITGRLASAVSPDYLEQAIRELHGNAVLRANLGAWGSIYVQNEWSIEAAYRQFFLMLRRLNILDGPLVPPRIHFSGTTAPGPVAAPSNQLRTLSWSPVEGIGDVEGPYPEFGLSFTFHWCCGPASRAALHCADDGRYILLIEHHNNFFPAQHVSISIDGKQIRSCSLAWSPPNTTGLLACVVNLTRGDHDLQLSFSHYQEPTPSESRRLALAVSRIFLERVG